ncbi:MAG: hypothetical protein ABIW81_08030 [Terrimesophilobacter sp.]
MQWWDDFVYWFYSDAGAHIVATAIVPGVAIVVAGVIAALIGRGATKRVISMHEREERASATAAMIGAARRFAQWNTLSGPEQQHADHVAMECDVRLRLLPLAGAAMASNWSAHQLAELKKMAVSFSFQAEQSLAEFRERLIDWQAHPGRAKKLFKNDLDSWAYDDSLTEQDLVAQQKAWQAQQDASKPVERFAPNADKEDYSDVERAESGPIPTDHR